MNAGPDPSSRSDTATRVFTAFLRESRDSDRPDFDSLRAENPELELDLRRLEQLWRALQSGSSPRAGVSLSKRLEERYGRGVDPGVQLDEEASEGGRDVNFATGVVERLAGRSESAGRYELRSEIARGGMGVVYSVWDEDLRRSLAMKVLLGSGSAGQERSSVDSRHVGRFLEEAQVTSQLDHPGVVPVHELGLDAERRLYFTMKYVKGRDLRHIIEQAHKGRAGWTVARVLGAMIKVCETMAYAHEKGVVHRDLKPANLMIGRFGAVYVMDWGLARVEGREDKKDLRIRPDLEVSVSRVESLRRDELDSDPDSSLVTMDGDVIGTPAYMPPEQARGELARVGKLSDVYSIGAMLYHLLSGQVPYVAPGTKPSARTVLARVLDGPPKRLHEIAPGVPAELAAICERAMAYHPEDRYARMEDLAEDLHAFQEGRVVRAYESGPLAELRKWVRRNRALSSAAAVVLFTTLAALFWNSRVEARGKRDVVLSSDLALTTWLREEADALWPADGDMVDDLESWLRQLDGLRARRGEHERRHAALTAAGDVEGARLQKRCLDGMEVLLAENGLGHQIERRLDFARTIEGRSISEPAARERWARAIASIADPKECPAYAGLSIVPQLGLLPLSRNPNSGLWEFLHLALHVGELPERNAAGEFDVTPETGIVLVLLPGGEYWMGAQSEDSGKPGYDPAAESDEQPVQHQRVEPFFISKYEVTQAQWMKFSGRNPAVHKPGYQHTSSVLPDEPCTLTMPVEQVSWEECLAVCDALALDLPSEVRWEYAARAGDKGPGVTRTTCGSLKGRENILDEHYARSTGSPGYRIGLDDGRIIPIEVDAMAPNGFGLVQMLGNVREHCLDPASKGYSVPIEERAWDILVARGGAWDAEWFHARFANRKPVPIHGRLPWAGLRPCRELRLDSRAR